MSKSLEALDELSLMINREKHINSEWNKKINDLKQTIKQDLERLESLKKENQELLVNKNFAQKLAVEYKNKIDKLEKQNQELKEKVIDISNKEQLMTAYYKDYKEAIKIMIRVNITPKIFSCALISHKIIFGSDMTYKEICADYNLTKEEFYLLKEVFSNE